MADTILSPVNYQPQFGNSHDFANCEMKKGKRGRSSMDEFDDYSCHLDGEDGGFGEVDFSNPEKRARNNSVSNSYGFNEDCVNPEKRSRTGSCFPPQHFSPNAKFSFNDSRATITRLETELRHERYAHNWPLFVAHKCNVACYFYRQAAQVKEEHIHIADLESKSLRDQLQVIGTRTSKVNEENTILKRAVNIQEGRMKELNQQNLQLQHVLAQAAQRISQLEQALSARNLGDDPAVVFDQRPPDVC